MVGEMLLMSLAIFPIMYFIGYLCDRILFSRDYGRILKTIIRILFFIGVIVHELSHRLVCALTGVPAHNTTVKYRPLPHGYVKPREPLQYTLLQGVLVCFAPLLIGTWLIYFLLIATFNPIFHPIFRIIAGFSSFSILLTLAPSRGDLSCI